jgi:hypothetical protein
MTGREEKKALKIGTNWTATDQGVWAITPWNARYRILTASDAAPMNGLDKGDIVRLAAAAPALLASCIEWLAWLDPENEPPENDAEIEAAILGRMRAAISLANQ